MSKISSIKSPHGYLLQKDMSLIAKNSETHHSKLKSADVFNSAEPKLKSNYKSDVFKHFQDHSIIENNPNWDNTTSFIIKGPCILNNQSFRSNFYLTSWATDATTEYYPNGCGFQFIKELRVSRNNKEFIKISGDDLRAMYYDLQNSDIRTLMQSLNHIGKVSTDMDDLAYANTHFIIPLFLGRLLFKHQEGENHDCTYLTEDESIKIEIDVNTLSKCFVAGGGSATPASALDNIKLCYQAILMSDVHNNYSLALAKLPRIDKTVGCIDFSHLYSTGTTSGIIDIGSHLSGKNVFLILLSLRTADNVNAGNMCTCAFSNSLSKLEITDGETIWKANNEIWQDNLDIKRRLLGYDLQSTYQLIIPFSDKIKECFDNLVSGYHHFTNNAKLEVNNSSSLGDNVYINIKAFHHVFHEKLTKGNSITIRK